MLESQRHLLQAVAHELRTPIARIAFSLEMLSEARDEAERDKRTEQMEEDLTELNQLVDELLLFTRFDAVDETLEKEQIQLPEVLLETIARIGATRPQIDIVVPAVTEEGLAIVAHHVYLKRAFQNLLTNAVRHAHQKVEVRFGSTDGGTCIEVLDDGPGIPQEAREAILEPFSRLDESRSRESGGVGLGLAIVRRIMAAHNGGVRIDDSPLGGAQFSLDFPN